MIEPDILDVAARLTTEAAERTIRSISEAAAKIDTTNPSEHCWASDCDGFTGKERRWCDIDCRDVYEKENR